MSTGDTEREELQTDTDETEHILCAALGEEREAKHPRWTGSSNCPPGRLWVEEVALFNTKGLTVSSTSLHQVMHHKRTNSDFTWNNTKFEKAHCPPLSSLDKRNGRLFLPLRDQLNVSALMLTHSVGSSTRKEDSGCSTCSVKPVKPRLEFCFFFILKNSADGKWCLKCFKDITVMRYVKAVYMS